MTTTPISNAPPGPGDASAAPRGAPDQPGTPFDRVLDEHEQAWTAHAGGQQDEGAGADAPPAGGEDAAPVIPDAVPVEAPAIALTLTLPAAEGDVLAAATPTPAQTGAQAVPGAVSAAVAAETPAPAAGEPVVAPSTSAPAGAQAPPAATAAATPAADAPAALAEAAADLASGPAGTGAGDGTDADADAGTARGSAGRTLDAARSATAGTTPAAARGGETASAAPAPTAGAGDPAPTAAPSASAPAASSATAPAAGAEPGPAGPAAAPAPTAAPATPAAPISRAPVSAPAVALPHAPAAVAEAVHVATSRGTDRARIVLHPESLGGIEIRIEHSAAGVKATLHVDHVDTLATLQSGLGDLRRGLEARGVTVETLDLGLAPGHGGDHERRNGAAGGDDGFGAARPGDADPLAPGEDQPLTIPTATTDRPAAGVLVDVMA